MEKIKRTKHRTSITRMRNNLIRSAPTTRIHTNTSSWSDREREREREQKIPPRSHELRWFIVTAYLLQLFFKLIALNYKLYNLYTCLCPYHVATFDTCNEFTLDLLSFSSLFRISFLQYLFHFAAATLYEYVHSIYKRYTNHPFIAVSHCSKENSIYLKEERARA